MRVQPMGTGREGGFLAIGYCGAQTSRNLMPSALVMHSIMVGHIVATMSQRTLSSRILLVTDCSVHLYNGDGVFYLSPIDRNRRDIVLKVVDKTRGCITRVDSFLVQGLILTELENKSQLE